jgi:hypothetical protein
MSPKFQKGQHVRVLAKFFNSFKKAERIQKSGRTAGMAGAYCGGVITRVLVKKRTVPQTYTIKWDGGTTMNCEEQHVEQAIEEDSEEGSEDGRDGEYDPDRNSDDGSTTSYDEEARGQEREQEDEKTNTDS